MFALGDRGRDGAGFAAGVQRANVLDQLIVHLAHLLCVFVRGVIGRLQRGRLFGKLLLFGEEHARVALISGLQRLTRQAVVFLGLDPIVLHHAEMGL